MGVFNGSTITPRAVPDPGTDHMLPPAGALSYGAITSTSALAGTNGADAALITGNLWLELSGDFTEDIHGHLKSTVFQNHIHKTIGDLNYTIIGNTNDTRIGSQVHTNVATRNDIFCHTRTETHHQQECQQQPTQRKDVVSSSFVDVKNSFQIAAYAFTIAATAIALFGFYARGVLVYLQSAEIDIRRKKIQGQIAAIKADFHALKTDIKGLKLKAAGAHLKAIAGNICAGIAFNMDSPWA